MILVDEHGVRIMSDKDILRAAKQREKRLVLDNLVEAIGRHPAAEEDPAVIDAINAIDDALKQFDKPERVC